MTEDATRNGGGTSRTVRIVLAVSLAFNLLIVGIVVGALIGGGRDGGRGPAVDGAPQGAAFVRALDRADQRRIRRELGRALRAEGLDREAMRLDPQAVRAALTADPFDPAAVEALLARPVGAGARGHALGREILARRIAAMSAEERAAYADRVIEELSRKGRRPPRK